MKKTICILFAFALGQVFAASWDTKTIDETIYAELGKEYELKTFFMKKKKSSEYIVNSLKQLTYRTFWNQKIVKGSVDITEIEATELEFILDREFSEMTFENIQKVELFEQISFYLGTHEVKDSSCLDLIMFDWGTKEAAIYSECSEL